ncbi:MAG: Gfo/Idh/MocA family oxidoreductase [bacterium]
MRKVKIGVIGCGAMAQGMHLPNIKKHPDAELLWCCDIDERVLETVKEKFSPKKVTKDARDIAHDPECDMVIIATTHKLRRQLIKLLSDAGKPIYVEKPMADNFEEMFEIARQIKKTGIPFCVGHNRHMSPAITAARNIYFKHKANPVSPAWRWDRVGTKRPSFSEEEQTMMLLRINDDYWSWKAWAFKQGGILISEMTHFADLVCCFIDQEPIRVTALGSNLANNVINIEFDGGSLATIFGASIGSFGYPKELIEIYHKGAAIIIDHLLELRVTGVVDEPFKQIFPLYDGRRLKDGISDYYNEIIACQKKAVEANDNSLLPIGPDKGHYLLLDCFMKEIRGGDKNPCGIIETMKATAIILKASESIKTGNSVEMSKSDYTLV